MGMQAVIYDIPAQKPSGQPYCGDFEGVDWPASGDTEAIPRGYPADEYEIKCDVPGILLAGPYQWGGERCGGWCTNVDGNDPYCTLR